MSRTINIPIKCSNIRVMSVWLLGYATGYLLYHAVDPQYFMTSIEVVATVSVTAAFLTLAVRITVNWVNNIEFKCKCEDEEDVD